MILLFWATIQKDIKSPYEYIGILAHEFRHIYQKTNGEKPANAKGDEALWDKHEIDADGFAICYVAHLFKKSLAEAADIVCGGEKVKSKKCFDARLEKAEEIDPIFRKSVEEISNPDSSEPEPKKGIFRRILNKLFK